jgi:hypothetical protein
MTRITYKDGNHSYWLLGDDGVNRRLRSVSTIIGPTKPDFSASAVRRVVDYCEDHWPALCLMPPSRRREALTAADRAGLSTLAARGTQIHAWADLLSRGEPVLVPSSFQAHVEGFIAWFTSVNARVLHAERIVWSPDDDDGPAYAGRFDAILEIDGTPMLVDYKTGKAPYANMAVQLTGYAEARYMVTGDVDEPMPAVHGLAVVHITASGTVMHDLAPGLTADALEAWQWCRNAPRLPTTVGSGFK